MSEIGLSVTPSSLPVWQRRIEDYRRHIHDLQSRSYEGASTREQREATFRTAFDLLTPVARAVLEGINSFFLEQTGVIAVTPPHDDGEGGLIGSWSIDWPLLRKAANRFNGAALKPLSLTTIFPLKPTLNMQWTHPHIALLREELPIRIAAAWPMQVTTAEDAERQEPILWVLAEAELHERTFEADLNWRILPFVVNNNLSAR